MAKSENQTRLVNALRIFTGKLPACYVNEKEFFLVSLLDMAEYLGDLQRDTLREACDGFIRKLDSGRATPHAVGEFKAVLDRLISGADFKTVCAAMAGSREFIKRRLCGLKHFSLLGEARKASGGDPEAERHICGAYARLNFPALVKQVEAAPNDFSANAALAKAREEVGEYSGLYRVQMHGTGTFTPFSMSCVDAALAASYRLYRNIARASGRAL